jgi:hypothetical protein
MLRFGPEPDEGGLGLEGLAEEETAVEGGANVVDEDEGGGLGGFCCPVEML